MKQILLENECIQLKPIQLQHIDQLYLAAQHEEIWTHMSDYLMTKEAVQRYIEQAIAEREAGISYKFVIVHKASNQIIGSTSFLDISAVHKRVEIGATWLSPKFWRTNVNTMCKFLLLQYCFEEMQLQRVQIKTGHENIRSQQAIERIGATKEGVLRNHIIQRSGAIRHTVMYSMIKEDWTAVKEKFLCELLTY